MQFRPCIDIHNGKVKQIVGGSLSDAGNRASENFVSEQDAAFYARLYRESGIKGGHIIMLNKAGTPEYEADMRQGEMALCEYPKGLQIGGGINADNAGHFIEMGASHVIVTSYVFKDGKIDFERLEKLVDAVGREHLVLDLSCRRKAYEVSDVGNPIKDMEQGSDKASIAESFLSPGRQLGQSAGESTNGSGRYFIVTDRWQKFTDEPLSEELLEKLSSYADEFLVHAVDVEGKASGVERELVALLAKCVSIPITYAGGVGSYEDIEVIREIGKGRVNVTIGSALDLFGGNLKYEKVLSMMDQGEQ